MTDEKKTALLAATCFYDMAAKVTSGDIPFGVGCIIIGDFIACAGIMEKYRKSILKE